MEVQKLKINLYSSELQSSWSNKQKAPHTMKYTTSAAWNWDISWDSNISKSTNQGIAKLWISKDKSKRTNQTWDDNEDDDISMPDVKKIPEPTK